MFRQHASIEFIQPSCANFNNDVTEKDLIALAQHARLEVLQCAMPVEDHVWRLLDKCFFAVRPDVRLRAYGYFWGECDLNFVRLLKHVRHFSADALESAINVEAIAEMPALQSLNLGIYGLETFCVLEQIPPTLTKLRLGATHSRKPSLAPLARLRHLSDLSIEGHHKDIEVLKMLGNLEKVVLRSISTPSLNYLSSLPKLQSVLIELGGIRSFNGIEDSPSLENFGLFRIRDVGDVDIVAALPSLKRLSLESLPRVAALTSLRKAGNLQEVVLRNMKGLSDFSALEHTPALVSFALLQGDRQVPEQLAPLLRNPVCRRVTGHFGSTQKDRAFAEAVIAVGKIPWPNSAYTKWIVEYMCS